MKYRKLFFENHPIFGSACFDFTDATGKTVDTIILAGENGCGKSFLLSFLNTYNPTFSFKELGCKVRVEVELTDDDLMMLHENKDFVRYCKGRFVGRVITFVHDTIFEDYNSRVEFVTPDGKKGTEYAFHFVTNQNLYRSVYSDVEINFSPNDITHTTSSNLDNTIKGSIRSSKNLATEIKQLLVDINELDNEELAKWVDLHKGQAPTDEVLHKRIRRFTAAFDKMFPYKHFIGIDNKENHKEVLFEEFGKQMEISQLSSGEKQIVFRGGFLLRNIGTINGAVVLVDEPELSLHPQWQLKILTFLKSLFTDEKGIQTSQIIVATHSPFIIHNNTRANDKVIVMQKNGKGEVKVLDKPEYYNWSVSTAVEEAFRVSPLLVEKKVFVFLEGETDEIYYNKAMEVYGFDSNLISFNWIGHYVGGKKDKAENTGDKALNSAAAFFKANPHMLHFSKVYLLYDCDTQKPFEREGNLFIGAMTKNEQYTAYKIGVENLLDLPNNFDYNKFYKTNTKTDDYGAVSKIVNLDKNSLAEYVTNLPKEQLLIILNNFRIEIENILQRIEEK